MPKNLLTLLLLCFTFSAVSQESINLKGEIIADSLEGSFINIVNISKEIGSVNNEVGEFQIEVSENDTLYFSSVQYDVKEVVVTNDIIKAGFLEVNLNLKVNELEEVKISNISLSGNLMNDLANIETINQAEYGIPYPTGPRPTTIERKMYTASSSALGLLINTLNGKIKMLKKARANERLAALVDKGMNALVLSFFVDDLGIPEEQVINFVYFCAEDPGFKALVNKARPLELVEYYQGKARYFLEERIVR